MRPFIGFPGTASPSRLERYARYKAAVAGLPLPLLLLDLDAFEANARALLARAGELPVRLCSKSIRCAPLLAHAQRLSPRFRGVLCYHAREAAWLATQGFDDIVVAYPTLAHADLDAACAALKRGTRLALMVDDAAQLPPIVERARAHGVVVPLAIDLDLSSEYPGVYFGVRRSPIKTPAQALALGRRIAAESGSLRLAGLLGYEAQLAGLPDRFPGRRLRSRLVRMLKRRSEQELRSRRAQTVRALRDAGLPLEFVNGGGTGSFESTRRDPSVTELAAGSGLYAPSLFDHYDAFRHKPSLYFALQVTRRPAPDIVTCGYGGYIASGPPGADRAPVPSLPEGLALLAHEGAGEVQTPLRVPPGVALALGDPVFFRHAKAGEVAERFERIYLVRGAAVVGEMPTYRGEGKCFF